MTLTEPLKYRETSLPANSTVSVTDKLCNRHKIYDREGYYVESRRGGGGYIKITRVSIGHEGKNYLMHIINSMGDSISQQSAHVFINNFVDHNVVTEKEAMLLKAATSDKALAAVPVESRGQIRASILKTCWCVFWFNMCNLWFWPF